MITNFNSIDMYATFDTFDTFNTIWQCATFESCDTYIHILFIPWSQRMVSGDTGTLAQGAVTTEE